MIRILDGRCQMTEQSIVELRKAKRKELQADPKLVQQRLSRVLAEYSMDSLGKLPQKEVVHWDGEERQPEKKVSIEARLEQIEKRLELLEVKR